MGLDFRIVVSSENVPYLAWQTLLFCFSALTRLGKHPTVVVHRTQGPLRPEFQLVKEWGCRVIEAPPFCAHPKGHYPPRNELGSLLTIAAHPDFHQGYIHFCEPDMIFVRRPQYCGALSGEFYHYLDYGKERIQKVARRFGIAARLPALSTRLMIGVPYLLPGAELSRLANRWIEVLDSFEELEWIDIMYAFGLTLAVENLSIETTHMMDHNLDPLKRLDRSIIHYCYGDQRWDKRIFRDNRSPLDPSEPIPSLRGLSGTVLGEILKQIRQARACILLPRVFSRLWRPAAGPPIMSRRAAHPPG